MNLPQAALVLGVCASLLHAEGVPKKYNVRELGAAGDGKTLDTAAIQKAIDSAAGDGGGEVDFPAGTYLTGSLELRSHVTVRLDKDAVILGSAAADDYPIVTARWEGIERPCHRALISARDAEDIAITGAGTIRGDATVGRLRNPRAPTIIEPISCKHVRVEGVTLKSTRIWTLHPTYCEDVTVSGVTFDTVEANSDGIDPDSCKGVLIDHCSFSTGDDDIAIKSGKGQEGVRIGKPSEDITITNCTFLKGNAPVAMGSELSGGIRNVKISHCTISNGVAALYLKSCPGRAGYVRDVSADHLDVTSRALLELETTYSHNPDAQGVPGPDGLTAFSHIAISDVTVHVAKLLNIHATPEKPLDGLTLTRITGACATGSEIHNVKNLALKEVHVQ
jgi:polygalacturonase